MTRPGIAPRSLVVAAALAAATVANPATAHEYYESHVVVRPPPLLSVRLGAADHDAPYVRHHSYVRDPWCDEHHVHHHHEYAAPARHHRGRGHHRGHGGYDD